MDRCEINCVDEGRVILVKTAQAQRDGFEAEFSKLFQQGADISNLGILDILARSDESDDGCEFVRTESDLRLLHVRCPLCMGGSHAFLSRLRKPWNLFAILPQHAWIFQIAYVKSRASCRKCSDGL